MENLNLENVQYTELTESDLALITGGAITARDVGEVAGFIVGFASFGVITAARLLIGKL